MTTCACKAVHGFDCQFSDEQASFNFAGQDWCRFHLPLLNVAGNPSPKGLREMGSGWEDGGAEWEAFKKKIPECLAAATSKNGRADFRGVVFSVGFDFGKSAWSPDVDFTCAAFGDRVSFRGARFGNTVRFVGATFGNNVDFVGAKFGNNAGFDGATFGNHANFNDVKIGDNATFEHASFGESTIFTDATFGVSVNFNDATFGSLAHFPGATFGNNACFLGAKFLGEVTFAVGGTRNPNFVFWQIDFSEAKFFGPCSFENCAFTAKTLFNHAEFHDLAIFHGCTFHQGMSFYKTEFLKTKESSLSIKKKNDEATEALERAYRTLKLGMENLRARNEEAYFFAKEMECRRHRSDTPWYERFAAFFYKLLSNYGQSIRKPLVWLIGFTAFMYGAYYLIGRDTLSDHPLDIFYGLLDSRETAKFTLEQMFRPFYVWAAPADSAIGLLKCNPLLIPFLASLQSLATFGLLTLFLLALRRRFKMD